MNRIITRAEAEGNEVLLGFEVGTGKPVVVPLAHTFVTGQTQLSGKTTTLKALVERSEKTALAFITKRGEKFEGGHRIRPFLPREGTQPIAWRLVETILASALGERKLKYERAWIMHAAKGAMSLMDVRRNVNVLSGKTKESRSKDAYMMIGAYLDLVLPDMEQLRATDTLVLQPGLNVMHLEGVTEQLQAMVIRACLEHVNAVLTDTLVVFPEAWEFAPRGRTAPAKDEAVKMARKGAVLHNYLLCDSQDIAGVETTIRQAASVWILGVQRELNELKRTIQMIPAGIKRPKPEDVATLELGQFYACWGRQAVKTYVQPSWMSAEQAKAIALEPAVAALKAFMDAPVPELPLAFMVEEVSRDKFIDRYKEATVTEAQAKALQDENKELRRQITDQDTTIDTLREQVKELMDAARKPAAPTKHDDREDAKRYMVGAHTQELPPLPHPADNPHDHRESFNGANYEAFVARLLADDRVVAKLAQVSQTRPEIVVSVKRQTIQMDGDTVTGAIAGLIADGFFDAGANGNRVFEELKRRGRGTAKPNAYKVCDKLSELGFLTKESDGYKAVKGMKVRIVEA